jgi:hypothetical protein
MLQLPAEMRMSVMNSLTRGARVWGRPLRPRTNALVACPLMLRTKALSRRRAGLSKGSVFTGLRLQAASSSARRPDHQDARCRTARPLHGRHRLR